MSLFKQKKIIRSTADIPEDPARPDTILVFHSSHGSAYQYAKWLVEALDCDVMPYSRQTLGYVILYRNVIFLSWVRAGELVRLKLLRMLDRRFLLPEKKVILAAVGAAEPTDHYRELLRARNMEGFFYPSLHLLPGRCDPSKGRILRRLYGRRMYAGLTPGEAEILRDRLENGWDGMDRSSLAPIVEEITRTRENGI